MCIHFSIFQSTRTILMYIDDKHSTNLKKNRFYGRTCEPKLNSRKSQLTSQRTNNLSAKTMLFQSFVYHSLRKPHHTYSNHGTIYIKNS